MPIAPNRFWRTAILDALRETYTLLFDRVGRMMIAALLFCIYMVLLWRFNTASVANGELTLKIVASVAPLLIFPFVFIGKTISRVSGIYRECYDKYQSTVEKAPDISVEVFTENNVTLCQILNRGSYFTLSPEIDFSGTKLSEAMYVHAEPQWLDGYSGGYRIFKEGSKNTFKLREIVARPSHVQEVFYGNLGARDKIWVEDTIVPISRQVRILLNSNPQFVGGHKILVLEFLGNAISLLEGEGTIRPTSLQD